MTLVAERRKDMAILHLRRRVEELALELDEARELLMNLKRILHDE